MAFGLAIGTERAQLLQSSIQDELQKQGLTQDADPVMAEYITIMLINNKTSEQITAELEDLLGAGEYDASFTDWLFTEAAKKSEPILEPVVPVASPSKPEERPISPGASRRAPTGPRGGATAIYNQALNQALPSGSFAGQKRAASARSPSPNQPNKSRRIDLPTGPRSMGSRSLLDRMGGRAQGGPRNGRDEIQARIEAVTHQNAMNAMNGGGFNNGMGGMMMPGNDMAAAAAAMGGSMMNPLAFQEMMMNQMALMAQMANNMGMLNNQGQFPGQNGFPMNGGNMPFPDGQRQNHQQQAPQGRGGAPNGRGRGRGGSLSAQWVAPHVADGSQAGSSSSPPAPAPAIVAPSPINANASAPGDTLPGGVTPPERPQSPSLCKFGLKCTNALCRYSHASPVATPESGVVLSNEACEAGIQCKDKDCIKAHVSPAAVGVSSVPTKIKPKAETAPAPLKAPCRYGTGCTKAASGQCPFSHPFVPKSQQSSFAQTTQCRFGAGCTRATCHFQHPPGRVLPGTFHRGLAENGPTIAVPTPEAGSIGAPSPHRSVVFNRPTPAPAAGSAEKEKGEKKEGENAVVEATA